MPTSSRSRPQFRPGAALILLIVFLGVLLVAGGASRADALGQVVVRAAAVLLLILVILLGRRPSLDGTRMIFFFLLAAGALTAAQLTPLPPDLWGALPGRDVLAEAGSVSGQPQPWRPWSMVPGATLNALISLIVPLVTLVLAVGLDEAERRLLPGLFLGVITASTLVALLQFSGAALNNPLINDVPGQVSGFFANRNHFALFVALGCLIAPVWAFIDGRPGWRGPVAVALVPWFVLTILACGSRAGMGLGVVAIGIGLLIVRREIRRSLRRYPRWVLPASVVGLIAVAAILVLVSVAADRAISIDRAFGVEPGRDMRSRGLPTVLAMVREYFPVGSGVGGFDPIFRMHEPFELLKLSYFNHAHNDWLEVVLDAGAPGLLLLLVFVIWWGWASVRAWRGSSGVERALPRLGSAMILLVMAASAFDYPARTPMIMAVLVVAGLWLGWGAQRPDGQALRSTDQHL